MTSVNGRLSDSCSTNLNTSEKVFGVPASLVSRVHSPGTTTSPLSCPRRNTTLSRRRISARAPSYRCACVPSVLSSLLRSCFCEALRQAPVVLFLYRKTSYSGIVFVITVIVITFCKYTTNILTSKQIKEFF